MYQGDEPSHMFYVCKGSLKYYDIDQNGSEKIIHLIGPQGLLPMLYAFGSHTMIDAFYSTLDDVELLLIPMDDFKQRVQTDVALCNLILGWFAQEAECIMMRLKSLEKNDAKSKVVDALSYLVAMHSTPLSKDWFGINFGLSQQIIADLTGLTRETVSNIMRELEPFKIIRSPKQLCVEINRKKLLELSNV